MPSLFRENRPAGQRSRSCARASSDFCRDVHLEQGVILLPKGKPGGASRDLSAAAGKILQT